MLFQIKREELDKVIAGYKPHKHTKKAIQAFQKDMLNIERYAESIEERKAETQVKLVKVLTDMEATFDVGERVYLQSEQDHLVNQLQALDVYLEECTERKTQARLKHAPTVTEAIDKDRKELLTTFNEEMNKAVRVGLSDIMQSIADVNVMLETEKQTFVNDVYDCLAGDEVVIDTYRFQNKRVSAETPLEVGYLNITHSDFLQAKSGHNTVKNNSFIVRNYCEEGGNA